MAWALRLLLLGGIAVIFGGVYLYHGLNGGDPDGIFADGLVKGPIGLLVGVALVVFGVRAMRPARPVGGTAEPARSDQWGRPRV